MTPGTEWLIDASGCDPERLCDLRSVRAVCEEIIEGLGLHVVGTPHWHQFPFPGGVTGMYLLSESHLTCHTFPESGTASFNLYCCRPRPEWDWSSQLASSLGAAHVLVRRIEREPIAGAKHPGCSEAAGVLDPELGNCTDSAAVVTSRREDA